MKQLKQSARGGRIEVTEVPVPHPGPGMVLVRASASLVSAGTERMALEFAGKNLAQKAQARPDLVRQVVEKARRDGPLAAYEAARARLDQPMSLGYSCAGTVLELGAGIDDLKPGDAVACAGAGYAVHAEMVTVPRMLLAPIPAIGGRPVSRELLEQAAFATVAAIALHGVRLAEPTLGSTVAVLGLGLLGQLAVQFLCASGCRVIGLDPKPERGRTAKVMGAETAATDAAAMRDAVAGATCGRGADAVIITADTSSNEPVELAGELARDRAVVVAVGAVGLDIPRRTYYEKELDLRISRSYGPGRYDRRYEEKGQDYPIAFVRWTETRNLEACLRLLVERKLNLAPLITHRFPIEQAERAYQVITGSEPFLGVLITYAGEGEPLRRVELNAAGAAPAAAVKLGILGAGSFATNVLLPVLSQTANVELVGIVSRDGLRARHAGEKFKFRYCGSDENELFNDSGINTVGVLTRHHRHAAQVIAALRAGKHVFCEKPLCLNESELAEIVRAVLVDAPGRLLTVGFNRRFSPMAGELKAFLESASEPLLMQYRVNAGAVSADHWIQDPEQGGGRILGEVCHFVDLLSYLCGALPVRVAATGLGGSGRYAGDNIVATLDFANGSVGTITYAANGDRVFSKERLEVFAGGSVGVLDDFRTLELVRAGRRRQQQARLRQDKGYAAEAAALVKAVQSGQPPIALPDLVATTLATIRIMESLRRGNPVEVNAPEFIEAAMSGGMTAPAAGGE